ncbi:hypothetical protein AFM18_11165 [Achromobacter spanius]|uniref:Uncharacterized protein n=1 Tax=Achromobacter spanius TaxID=217203 RepID=A0AAW3I4K1_9BURK|nr:hypothetical protein AFM18_11165 [Achromobacter spanius]
MHHLIHRAATALSQLRGAFGLAARQVGIARRELDGVGQLRHVGGGFLQGPGLARGAVGHIRAPCRDLAGPGMNFLDAPAHRCHRRRQARLHAAHGGIQDADFIVAAHGDRAGQIPVRNPIKVRARLVQRTQNAAPKCEPDQHGQHQHHRQHRAGHHDDVLQRLAGAGHRRLALFARIGLVGIRLLHIGRAAVGQHLVHQAVHFNAVPRLRRLQHGRHGLVREGGVGRQQLFIQRAALRARVRVGAQLRQAFARLLEQRLGMRQRLVARLFQPTFHAGFGISQRGPRLEQAAGHVGQIAGAFDTAPAQGFDVGAVVAQYRDARRRRNREQQHKQRQNGRYRRGDPKIFPHIHPSETGRPQAQCHGLWTGSLAIS